MAKLADNLHDPFTYLCLKRHSSSSCSFKPFCIIYNSHNPMIPGNLYGVRTTSHQQKCISTSVDTAWYIMPFRWLWRSPCQNKHRVFFWLILKGKLNIRGVSRKRNMELESYNCVLCSEQAEETIEHLFIDCPFAMDAWQSINLTVFAGTQPLQNLELLKTQINQSFFMEIIILF